MGALIESAGFDPFIGFVHGLRYGRQSLPLDLIEEFRHPVVDGLVMTVINNGSIKKEDFYKEDNGAYFLDKEAFKQFLGYYDGTRSKLANLLLDYGTRVQYSVFELMIDENMFDELVERLKPFPECSDSIRIYHICEGCLKKAILLGRGEFEKEVSFHIV